MAATTEQTRQTRLISQYDLEARYLNRLRKSYGTNIGMPNIFFAAFHNCVHVLARFIKNENIKVWEQTHVGLSVLSHAIWGNAGDAVKLCLLQMPHCAIDKSSTPPMIFAVIQNSVRAVDVIASHKSFQYIARQCDENGLNALHYATSSYANEYMVRVLSMTFPDMLCTRCKNGYTPLMYAVRYKQYDIVVWLLSHMKSYYNANELLLCHQIATSHDNQMPQLVHIIRITLCDLRREMERGARQIIHLSKKIK